MVIIPKVGWEYRGIELVEFIWKVYVLITDNRLWSVITLYGTLQGYRQGRGA